MAENRVSDWVPFFQTLLWVLMIGVTAVYFKGSLDEFVRITVERARAGGGVSFGPIQLVGGTSSAQTAETDRQARERGAPSVVRLARTQTRQTLDDCIGRGVDVLRDAGFMNLGRNDSTAYGYDTQQAGAVWCLENEDLAVFMVAGGDWQVADDRVAELRDRFDRGVRQP